MKHPPLIRINELFTCDAEAGVLRWKISARGITKGAEAGSSRNKGRYRYVSVDGRYFTVANIVWFIHHGEWPKSRIAPKNGDQSDCSIKNLVPQRSLTGAFDHSTPEGHAAYCREHRKAHPDHYRGKELKKNFGITLADYQRMFVEQGGVCGICRQSEKDARNGSVRWLAVDHNHETGAVRGLLCGNCNKAIGFMCESPERLAEAIAYLRKHEASVETAASNVVTLKVRQGGHS